ncbi:MAG: type IV toxin-antitoxin system AbiEi family antitoxin domain-containing protein [Syntrophobacteraceae bacterium]
MADFSLNSAFEAVVRVPISLEICRSTKYIYFVERYSPKTLNGRGRAAMNKTRIAIAKPDIVKCFETQPTHLFKRSGIEAILRANRASWRLAQATTVNRFLNFLEEKTKLKAVKISFPSRTETRYLWGEKTSVYQLALSLQEGSYLTHYTAMYLHGLTEQIPKTIYVNFEQQAKDRPKSKLEQKSIDWAFKQKPRTTNRIASYEDQRICVLNGMHTGRLGVVETEDDFGEKIWTTNIERTLIDIAVRPFYAGGVFEVLKAYRAAAGKVSVNRIVAMLKKLDYVYPYHQAIGFYLERSGAYKETSIRLLEKLGAKYDFYLTYQMKDMDYAQKWRLFFPKDF